jgi:hypothetical protein
MAKNSLHLSRQFRDVREAIGLADAPLDAGARL